MLGALLAAAASAAWGAAGPALADGAGLEALLADVVKAAGGAVAGAVVGYAALWHATSAIRSRPVVDPAPRVGADLPRSVHTTEGD
ncbi:hypothetical protein GXB85_16350 [Cellulomonas sp. APG4]|uniref:hypothetical protein n=1 Tax=Cellulomonas sp. APG4 TaxID=1538656 RepID=UPI0013799E17|nr:hypothetical protein [Cellulomonas sp. APG4]NCT92508.1 hypothetical protein [Cellulomonas sp. APG4]